MTAWLTICEAVSPSSVLALVLGAPGWTLRSRWPDRPDRTHRCWVNNSFVLLGERVHAVHLEVEDPVTTSYSAGGSVRVGLNAKVAATS